MSDLVQSKQDVVIANNGTLSGASITSNRTLVGLQTPSAWTAAAITFDVSVDGTTYVPLYDDTGTEVIIPSASIATAAARGFSLDPADFVGWKYVKVRSGVNGTTVAQGAARTITLIFREVV